MTDVLLHSGVKAVAFETITDDRGALPCLRPMSEIAGRLSVQEGAKYLEKPFGGRGILLGGVPGVEKGKVVVLGGGIAGTNACRLALGMGAQVTVLDLNLDRLAYLDDLFDGRITTLYNTPGNLETALTGADLVIGAVLVAGASTPKVLKREHLRLLKPGAVIVDIAIDQGGCFETSRPTTHEEPTYFVDGILHYCVANIPRCGALHLDARTYERNAAVRHPTGGQGLASRLQGESRTGVRIERRRRKGRLQTSSGSWGLKYEPLAL